MTLAQSLSNNTNNSKTSNSSNNSKNSPVTSTSFSAAPSLSNTNTSKISALQFEKIANTYLEDLNEYFDSVMDDLDDIGADYDVTNLVRGAKPEINEFFFFISCQAVLIN